MQPSTEYLTLKQQLSGDGFLAIHVRGGDYLKKNSEYSRLSSAYYISGLSTLSQIQGQLRTLVFTDDLKFAKHLLAKIPDLQFMESNLTAAESMKLMSNAKGIVCANSTFSYWASIMSGESSSIVAPKNWMTNASKPASFFPEDWTII